MLRRVTVLMMVALGGCTVARMEGFDAIAAQSERLDITGIPGWMNGSFALGTGGTRGQVKRRALGRSQSDGWDNQSDPVVVTDRIARYGRVEFDVSGPEVGGALAGECRYDREAVRDRAGAVTVSGPTVPLALRCRFMRGGEPAGDLLLTAADRSDQPFAEAREGRVRFEGAELTVRSVHGIAGLRTPSEQRMGYTFANAARPVGAVELNGGTARMALPQGRSERQAALAASLALALFWDPGDTDD